MAHRHFGETYKWMLYGDDDTLFYLPGVLRLLSHFDPEQPLALTDNIWYYALHPSPFAPRCLPCGFNTSAIKTNHSFTPRPACPFCTRALACGTYGPRYRCNATHLADLERGFGPALLRVGARAGEGGAAEPGTGTHAAGPEAGRFREGMRRTGAEYAAWMARHAALKGAYPEEWSDMPAMDWEMRDPRDGGHAAGSAAAGEAAPGPEHGLGEHHRSRIRRAGRSLRGGTAGCGSAGDGGPGGAGRRRLAVKMPAQQRYVDGTPWLSAALGRDLSRDPAEKEALRLPYPFCARHDEGLPARAAPNCLSSISGHGGTGIIFSVGLMRLIDPGEAIRYITTQRGCGGGDCLLGRVLWSRMGIGFTDPGSALQHGQDKYERYVRFVDSNLQMPSLRLLADPMAALLSRHRATARHPACGAACVWLIENVVGTHVRAQRRQVNATVEAMLGHLRTHEAAYAWVAAARRDPDVAAGRVKLTSWIQQHYYNHTGGATGSPMRVV